MSMKTTDVKDVTIRAVGDVTKVSTGDVAKSGADSPDLGVAAPKSIGQPSAAPTGAVPVTVPSVAGLPPGAASMSSSLDQPDEGTASEADSVQTSKAGQGISWPVGADTQSAGGAKDAGGSFVLKTGSAVKFPDGANTSAPVKMVETFGS